MAKIARMIGLAALAEFVLFAVAPSGAHPPEWTAHPVQPRIDVIPPLGNRLPLSYAARYNRPAYLTGKIAYCIAPSSQEAMAWHRAAHRGYYANHAPRMVTHYMYPKPWEVLGSGSKPSPSAQPATGMPLPESTLFDEAEGLAPAYSQPVEIMPPPAMELLPIPQNGR